MAARELDIVHPRVERYLRSLIPPRDRVMAEMEARATREGIPIVGPVVGRLFYQLALMTRARRVMELGSAIGYSTLWWARAVGGRGRVWFTDRDPANAREARKYLTRARVADRVTFLAGDALERMREVRGSFDIVFCDIDKHGYPEAFEAAMRRLVRGGLFVCDNTLWDGRVAFGRASATKAPATAAIQRLNRQTYASDERAFTTLVPLRDGVTVTVKR
jgi:caffeoyl-CoA O-methyltransferase